jgi:hypothetical protein
MLILTGTKDLLNPEFEPQAAAKAIKNVRVVTISPGRGQRTRIRWRRISGGRRVSQPGDGELSR